MPNHTLRKNGPIDLPPGQERMTIKQIAAAQEARRQGDSLNLIAQRMGISKESIYRHTKGIKPRETNNGETPKPPVIEPVAKQNNGSDSQSVDTPKPSMIRIDVELDPDTMLMLAGTASISGYPNLKAYLNEYAMPWLRAITESKVLISAETPEQFIVKLQEIAKGYVKYQKMLEQVEKEVKEDGVKSDGTTNIVSQKN